MGKATPGPRPITALSDLGHPGRILGAAAGSPGLTQVRLLQQERQQRVELEKALGELRAQAAGGAHSKDAATLQRMIENELAMQGSPVPTREGVKEGRSYVSATQKAKAGPLLQSAEADVSRSGLSSNAEVPGTSTAWPATADVRAVPQQAVRLTSAALDTPDWASAAVAGGSRVQATKGGFAEQGEAAMAPLDCPDLGASVFQDFAVATGRGAEDRTAMKVQSHSVLQAACPWQGRNITPEDLELESILRSCDFQPFGARPGRPEGRDWRAHGDLELSESVSQGNIVDLPALAFETGCHDLLMRLT